MTNAQTNSELQIALGFLLLLLLLFGTLVLGKLTNCLKFDSKYDQNTLQGNLFSGGPV